MSSEFDILRLRVLLSFLNEKDELCTVTGLARMLDEGKQKISRQLTSLEDEGLIDKSNPRRPKLTDEGKKLAEYYEERRSIALNHMLYEGLDMDAAEHDADVWAALNSEETMQMIRNSEQIYHAKYILRRKTTTFKGDEFCSYLSDGDYTFPFLFYREGVKDGNNLSMANRGFKHPCTLRVKDGKGEVLLKAVSMSAESPKTGKEMQGKIRSLEYMKGSVFVKAEEKDEVISFPANVLDVISMGEGIGQILHGSVCLKMQCSVGTAHMPESTAIFTIIM